MKHIKSNGSPISFLLSGTEPLIIDEAGVVVTDGEAEIIVGRLGMQVTVSDEEVTVAPVVEETPVIEETEVIEEEPVTE